MNLFLLQLLLIAEEMPLKKLPGEKRAVVLAALAGLIILGFAMALLIWLGARITRRYMHGTSYHKPTERPSSSDWSPKPLQPGEKFEEEP